ncbi:MAG: hypothetical protein JXR38_02205, partial [Bacilli bacterium]|nr:hypothetical protein [Bacilli bacterium]
MKKFFGNLVIILSLLLVSLVAIPWNNLSQWWGLTVPVLSDNELYIKAGIGGLMLIFGIIFLIVANREHRNYGHVTPKTAGAAFLPMWSYAIAGLIYALVIMLFVYSHTGSQSDLMILAGVGFVLLNVMVFGHMMSAGFRKQRNLGRVLLFILLFELMALAMGAAYFMRMIVISDQFYASMYTYLYIGVLGVTLILAIVHIIIVKSKSKKRSEEVELEAEIDSIRETRPAAVSQAQPKGTKKSQPVVAQAHDGKKTMIVSKEQTIVSGEQNLDPTQMLYEDVAVDPEFSKTTNQEKQVSSIEYYIEKPKMFKPLDPTFDQLVEYVRELPQVVTKIADEKITFYVDRRPFLVLMNYGNYYRMAF